MCKLTALLFVLSVAASGGVSVVSAQGNWIETSGDILQLAMPALSGGATFFANPDPDQSWDQEGTRQFFKSYGTAWATMFLVKLASGKERPEGTNRLSFPSGHTTSTFASAAFIDGRYGRRFGAPAYVLATWTGYSRIHAKKHYPDDVLAGASIGLLSNWLFTSPLPGRVQWVPTVSGRGYGFQVSVGTDRANGHDGDVDDRPRGVGYRVAFAEAILMSNVAGSGVGKVDLGDLEGNNDPTATAQVSLAVPVGNNARIQLQYSPFEARDKGVFSQDVSWGGTDFAAGTSVRSAWRLYQTQLTYRRTVISTQRWIVGGLVGAGAISSQLSLATTDGVAQALVKDFSVFPLWGADLAWQVTERWVVQGRANGTKMGAEELLQLRGEILWRPDRIWDVALGYGRFHRARLRAGFDNRVDYQLPYVAISRFW